MKHKQPKGLIIVITAESYRKVDLQKRSYKEVCIHYIILLNAFKELTYKIVNEMKKGLG